MKTDTATARFLAQPYGAYFARDTPTDDTELTRVGPGTPCGEWMRRYWNPVAYSHEIGSVPLRLRVMCEDLVLFRDGSGRVGLLQLNCCHRGASLEYGIVMERGIRCCYHGWLFDVDGRILETPAEPASVNLKTRLCQGAYPVHEYKGLVFAYMGPPDRKPAFPVYDWYELPDDQLVPGPRTVWPCNWLQIKENVMDPVHLVFLHTIISGSQFTDEFGKLSQMDYFETPIGMAYASTARVDDNVWVRISEFIMPNIHQVPPTRERAGQAHEASPPMVSLWTTPIDDTSTINFSLWHVPVGTPPESILKRFGQDGNRPYAQTQLQPGDYEAQVSQGAINAHSREHLATSDRGIVQMRNMIRQAIRAVQAGDDPKGLAANPEPVPIPTYASNSVYHMPARPSADDDSNMLREAGQGTTRRLLAKPPRQAAT